MIREINAKRNGAVDFWKFIFAVVIFLFHSINLPHDGNSMFVGGTLAVEFFFIVSGALMAKSASRYLESNESLAENTVSFIKRKVMGLFPALCIAWVIAFLAEAATHKYSLKKAVQLIISSVWELLLIGQSGLEQNRFNGVTWYISAMLLAMAVLFPILLKYKKFALHVITPLIALFVYGWLAQSGNLNRPAFWHGFAFRGFLRCVAGISLGCVCYVVSEKLKQMKLTKLSANLLSFVEIVGYGATMVWLYGHKSSRYDYAVVLLFIICIVISFSKKGSASWIYDNKVSYWLGNFSYMLYLGHAYWSQMLPQIFPQKGYWDLFWIYALVSVATAFFIMFFSKLLSQLWSRHGHLIRGMFVAD